MRSQFQSSAEVFASRLPEFKVQPVAHDAVRCQLAAACGAANPFHSLQPVALRKYRFVLGIRTIVQRPLEHFLFGAKLIQYVQCVFVCVAILFRGDLEGNLKGS